MSDLVQQACDAYDAVRGKDGPSPEGYADYRAMEAALAFIKRAHANELASLLPGPEYMDPPDGGDVDLLEQCRRMSEDAAKWRALSTQGEAVAEICYHDGRRYARLLDEGSGSLFPGTKRYTHPTPTRVTEEMVEGLRRAVEACNQPCFTDKGEREISWAAVSWMQSNGPALLAALTAALEADK